ncbi:hypothetical protein GPU96_03g05890 [Encephalitozoon hellem]|nr:hypothetical protein GPU96_03g04180 [Encephalitozoon hellem]UTX42865.1 hypothetical protein GPU96_03g05890 [Encephalitozoon hellem]
MDMFEEMIEDIEGSQIIENMNYLVGKYSYDNGMVGRIIGKIEDLGIGSVCIGLAVVVAVHCIIWGVGAKDAVVVKVWNTGVYYVSAIGGLLCMMWLVCRSFCGDGRGTRQGVWTGVVSMVPMVVGILSVGVKGSRESIGMGVMSCVMVGGLYFVCEGIRGRSAAVFGVGSMVMCVVRGDAVLGLVGDGVWLYVCGALFVSVCMVLGVWWMCCGFECCEALCDVVFAVCVVVSTAISWSGGGHGCVRVSGCDREID